MHSIATGLRRAIIRILMKLVQYLNGKWVHDENLKVSVYDVSVLRGFGIFDFLRTYRQQPFMLKEHVQRLFNSAKVLGIKLPWTREEIVQIVLEGIHKNRKLTNDFNIRIVVTGGIGADSVTPGKGSLVVIFAPLVDFPKSYFEEGVKIITYPAKRVVASAKSLNYLVGIMALQKAKKEQAVEAVYRNEKGKLYEGTTSNFFGVINKTLVTPKEEILIGITRQVLLKLAKKRGIKFAERDLYYKDVSKFTEAFLTASNKEIMPVIKIDTKKVGNGKVGPITKQIMEDFKTLTDSYSFS